MQKVGVVCRRLSARYARGTCVASARPRQGALIHHSDRGVQYICTNTENLSAQYVRPSIGRVGNPCDNAKAESFMKTLKQEEINGSSYPCNLRHARSAIGAFRNRIQPPAAAFGSSLPLAGRVRNSVREIFGGDLTAGSLGHRELLLNSGSHARGHIRTLPPLSKGMFCTLRRCSQRLDETSCQYEPGL